MSYNESLQNVHGNYRDDTIDKLNNAIKTIKTFEGENTIITAKKIVDNSDLSRSVLYKPHALKVWNPTLWEEKYREKTQIEIKLEKNYGKNVEILNKDIDKLNKDNLKLEKQLSKLKDQLKNEKIRSAIYKQDYEEVKLEMKQQRESLLGECQRLNNLLHMHGIVDNF